MIMVATSAQPIRGHFVPAYDATQGCRRAVEKVILQLPRDPFFNLLPNQYSAVFIPVAVIQRLAEDNIDNR